MRIIPELKEGTHRAKATGTLPNGKPVIVNADGTVSVSGISTVTETVGSNVVFEAGFALNIDSAYDSNAQKVVVAYRDADNSSRGTAVVGTISGTSLSFGTPVVFDTSNSQHIGIAYDANAQKMVIAYGISGVAGFGIVGTVSGTSISFGTRVSLGITVNDCSVAYDSSAQKVVVAYKDAGASGSYGRARVGTVSGTSISFGTEVVFASHALYETKIAYDSTNSKVVIAYTNGSDGQKGTSIVGTVSSTSISFGSAVVFDAGEITALDVAYDVVSGKSVIVYQKGPGGNQGANAIVGTISGTGISFGTAVVYDSGSGNENNTIVYHEAAEKVIVVYWDNSNSDRATALTGTVSGTTISFENSVVLEQGASSHIAPTYDSTNKVVFVALKDGGNSNYGTGVVYQPTYASTNLTAENYIGMSSGSASSNSVTQVVGGATVFESATADIISATFDSNSNKVVVSYQDEGNSGYGTSVVGTLSGNSISFGTPVVFNSANSDFISSTFDSSNNKVVISFRDLGDGARGKAIVGTVSGTGISFGSEVDFNSTQVEDISITFDSNSNKVVISWNDNANNGEAGTAIVGTVSGTNISFGSAVVFAAPVTRDIVSTFDSNSNRVVIAYRDVGNSQYGTAIVGTVSGTSISFGTEVVFSNAVTYLYTPRSIAFDSGSNKIVVAYNDGGDSNKGTAIVGTVSGTSISFGTAVVFDESNLGALSPMSVTYDASANRVVISYKDTGNSSYGTLIAGSVSGTSISFESPVVFEAASTDDISSTFDSNANKVVIAYKDVGNSNYGTAVVTTTGYTDITRGQVNAGSSGTVDIIGSLSTNQLGLTAGQQYYVQTDGTIGETAADPSVFAGTAISATSLVVKT